MLANGRLGNAESRTVFLTFHPLEGKISPIAIHKCLTKISKNIEIQRTRTGGMLMKAEKSLESQLLNLKQIGNVKVEIKKHNLLNSSKGTIFCPELEELSQEETNEFSTMNNITNIKRIERRNKDGIKTRSHIYELQFDESKPPEKVNLGYLKILVRPVTPRPLQCYKCYKFGHPAKYCRDEKPICGKCGEEKHEDACIKKPYCVNCTGNHPAWSWKCRLYNERKQIEKIKAENLCSVKEATRHFYQTSRRYATVASQVDEQKSSGVAKITEGKTDNELYNLLRNISTRLEQLETSYKNLETKLQECTQKPQVYQTPILAHTIDNFQVQQRERRHSTISTDTNTTETPETEIDWSDVEKNYILYKVKYGIEFTQFKNVIEKSIGQKDVLSILHENNIRTDKEIQNVGLIMNDIPKNHKSIPPSLKARITRTKTKLANQILQRPPKEVHHTSTNLDGGSKYLSQTNHS